VAVSAMGLDIGGAAVILGIDPGREKAGWALVEQDGTLLVSGMFRVANALVFFRAVAARDFPALEEFVLEKRMHDASLSSLSEIVMGNGTGKEYFLSLAQSASLGVKLVPERGTTLTARNLYWMLHPPRGFWRLISTKFRVPPRDIDDFAAWAIVRCYCGIQSEEDRK